MIWILSGPIRSGKTTALYSALAGKQGVGGFLSPDRAGRRWIHALASGKWFVFQHLGDAAEHSALVTVGRFSLYGHMFAYAGELVRKEAGDPGISLLVLDEIGKLECRGLGFSGALRHLLHSDWSGDRHLLLVIRDSLLEEARERFSLQAAPVIRMDEIPEWVRLHAPQ